MSVILGIDVGTQSLKAMLLDTEKGCLCSCSAAYEVLFPEIGYAEENPADWWEGLKKVLAKMRENYGKELDAVDVIGLSGQMHGIVAVDRDKEPVMPAIIWVDQRSKKQVEEISARYSEKELARLLHNKVFTGYGIPSLLWIKEEQPDIYERIHRICCPKDYIRMKLTGGEAETDMSDASSTIGFDMRARKWNDGFLSSFGIRRDMLPDCHESTETAGTVSAGAAAETGLREGIRVVYGSGDMVALTLGCGLYREGLGAVNIGTGANYSSYSGKDVYDSRLRLHEFCHGVDRAYLVFGAILSGGLSLSWLNRKILGIESYEELDRLAMQIPAGSEGVVFLPYLGGERTPHMDYNASGLFFGLQHKHDRRNLCRAVLEGVTFALKDCERAMRENGIDSSAAVTCGGGAKSRLWLQMQADILEKEIVVTMVDEQACLGACIIAGIGAGIFASAKEGCNALVRYQDVRYTPRNEPGEVYRYRYEIYRSLYPKLRELMESNQTM